MCLCPLAPRAVQCVVCVQVLALCPLHALSPLHARAPAHLAALTQPAHALPYQSVYPLPALLTVCMFNVYCKVIA